MFLFYVLVLTILCVKCQGVYINGKEYDEYRFSKNGVSHRILHQKGFSSLPWVARSVYNKTYLTTGWDSFDLETNPEVDDNEQAFLAGYLEGAETHEAIYDHYFNTLRGACDDKTELCQRINHYLDTNIEWIKGMVQQHDDPYWNQGVSIAERSKMLDFESALQIAQVRILSVTVALFVSTIDLVLYQLSLLFCLIRSSHRPVAHEDGQSKA
ncbi:putative phospholipase B-like 2 [Homalodisca vitripennis]|nr:putative phospholipase B-like 2 [Homalodisca vitripennis]